MSEKLCHSLCIGRYNRNNQMGVKFASNMDRVLSLVEILWLPVHVVDELNQLVEVSLNT